MLIQRIAGGHKGDHAARTYLIKCFCKKVIMDGESELVISLVVDLVIAEGDIANSQIKKITLVRCFKAGDGNVSLRV